MGTRLPTAEEINVFDTLDERHAVEVFLGKDLEQAEALFRENFLYYQEDLMFMGPKAFVFYVPAAIRYLLGAESSGDSDAANTFCGVIESRLDQEPDAISPVGPLIREGILGMLGDFDRYACDGAIYGDLAARCRDLLSRLKF
jgi:hypothetical protein